MDELINGVSAKRGRQVGRYIGQRGFIARGFLNYSAALLSRTPKNEGYIDG